MSDQNRTPVVPEWTFGDRVRKVRSLAGLSKIEFAELLEVSAKTVARWEAGACPPREPFGLAQRVEVRFGVSAQWLLAGGTPAVAGRC